jgi:hypothetical protein
VTAEAGLPPTGRSRLAGKRGLAPGVAVSPNEPPCPPEPEKEQTFFCLLNRKPGDLYVPPEEWQKAATCLEGSWWPSWSGWLKARSGAPALAPAPGSYVLQR